jgi:hypothetical protein
MPKNIVGLPARGDDFFGREDLASLLWDRLDSGNVLLAAPRRFGKTSLMYRLLDDPKDGWKVLHVDAESIREPVNFIVALLDALLADRELRNFLLSAWKKAGAAIRGLFDELELTTPWDVAAKVKFKDKIAPDWLAHGQALLEALRGYDCGTRLLFIIDELPVMLHLFRDNNVSDADARAFLHWFRKLRTDPKVGLTNCRFLVGGSVGIEPHLSRLGAVDSFNDFERFPLPELSDKQAARFLKLLLADRRVRLSAACRRRILELTGAPIPYFVQVFVSNVAAAKAHDRRPIGLRRLEAIYQDDVLGPASKGYFQHYYDRLSRLDKATEQAAKALLKELALAAPNPVARASLRAIYSQVLGEAGTDEEFSRLMAELENDFYIRCLTGPEGCAFASKILCDWWRRYYAL